MMPDNSMLGNYYVKNGPSEKRLIFCLFQDTDGTAGSLLRGELVTFQVGNDEWPQEHDCLEVPKDAVKHWVTCVLLGVELETFTAEPGNVFHLKCRVVRVDDRKYEPNDTYWCQIMFRIHDRTGRMRVFRHDPNPRFRA